MKEYIKESNKRLLKEWKEWFLFKRIPFTILKPFNSNIQIPKIISIIEKSLKDRKYLSYLEGVYVGDLPQLKNRNIQAMFNDGVIYVSNFSGDSNITEERIAKDIVHEVGHLLEYVFGMEIYADSSIEQEFIGKRQRLYDILAYDGVRLNRRLFLSTTEYSSQIDDFLYKEIGYAKLSSLILGLFLSPYCVTSLSEYFANGFEKYQTGDINYLRSISPVLFSKLEMLDGLVKES